MSGSFNWSTPSLAPDILLFPVGGKASGFHTNQWPPRRIGCEISYPAMPPGIWMNFLHHKRHDNENTVDTAERMGISNDVIELRNGPCSGHL